MNALKSRKRYDAEQCQKAREQRQKELAEKLANMTDEERQAYEEEKRKRQKILAHMLSMTTMFTNVSYLK